MTAGCTVIVTFSNQTGDYEIWGVYRATKDFKLKEAASEFLSNIKELHGEAYVTNNRFHLEKMFLKSLEGHGLLEPAHAIEANLGDGGFLREAGETLWYGGENP